MNEATREEIRSLMREAARAGLTSNAILALEVAGFDWDDPEWDVLVADLKVFALEQERQEDNASWTAQHSLKRSGPRSTSPHIRQRPLDRTQEREQDTPRRELFASADEGAMPGPSGTGRMSSP